MRSFDIINNYKMKSISRIFPNVNTLLNLTQLLVYLIRWKIITVYKKNMGERDVKNRRD